MREHIYELLATPGEDIRFPECYVWECKACGGLCTTKTCKPPRGLADIADKCDPPQIRTKLSNRMENIDELINLRNWLEKAITDAGAEITDGGIGHGYADVEFLLEGMPYAVSIKPRIGD